MSTAAIKKRGGDPDVKRKSKSEKPDDALEHALNRASKRAWPVRTRSTSPSRLSRSTTRSRRRNGGNSKEIDLL